MWRSSLPHPPPHPTHTTTTTTPPSSRWEPSGLTIITSLLLHPATQHYHTTTPAHTSSFHLFLPFCTHQSPPPIKVGAFRPDQSSLLPSTPPHHLFLPSCTHHTPLLKVGAFGLDHNHLSSPSPRRTTLPHHNPRTHLIFSPVASQPVPCTITSWGVTVRCTVVRLSWVDVLAHRIT